jgi:hypothetical protein
MKERNNWSYLTLNLSTKGKSFLRRLWSSGLRHRVILYTATRGHHNPDATIGLLTTVKVLNLILCLLFTVVLPRNANLLHRTTAYEQKVEIPRLCPEHPGQTGKDGFLIYNLLVIIIIFQIFLTLPHVAVTYHRLNFSTFVHIMSVGSKVGPEIGYPNRGFPYFFLITSSKWRGGTLYQDTTLLATSFPIHYSLTILSLITTEYNSNY